MPGRLYICLGLSALAHVGLVGAVALSAFAGPGPAGRATKPVVAVHLMGLAAPALAEAAAPATIAATVPARRQLSSRGAVIGKPRTTQVSVPAPEPDEAGVAQADLVSTGADSPGLSGEQPGPSQVGSGIASTGLGPAGETGPEEVVGSGSNATTNESGRCWSSVGSQLQQRARASTPRNARRRGLAGEVVVRFSLGSDGRAHGPTVESCAGPELLAGWTLDLLAEPFGVECPGEGRWRVVFEG